MDESEKRTVEIQASGYEWMCLACETVNHEIAHKENVTCKACGATFETDPPEHAYE